MKLKLSVLSFVVIATLSTSVHAATSLAIESDVTQLPNGVSYSRIRNVNESVGVVPIRIIRSGTLRGRVSVDYTVRYTGFYSNATPGQDFNMDNGRVTFEDGVSAVTLLIEILNDGRAENIYETLHLILANPVAENPRVTGIATLGHNFWFGIKIYD